MALCSPPENICALVTVHGLGAEDGVYQRSAGAQSDPTWRHLPERGAGGEQEELSEKSSPAGVSGRITEGETGKNIIKGTPTVTARWVQLISFFMVTYRKSWE